MAVRTTPAKGAESAASSGLNCVGSRVAYHCTNQEPHGAGRKLTPCAGNSVRIDPPQLWDNCFRCHRPMGCPGCVDSPICTVCLVVTDYEYFLEHGPLSNDRVSINRRGERRAAPLTVYPSGWQSEYLLAHSDTAMIEDQELYDRFKRAAETFSRKAKMPHDPTKRELQRQRNRQVEIAVADRRTAQHG